MTSFTVNLEIQGAIVWLMVSIIKVAKSGTAKAFVKLVPAQMGLSSVERWNVNRSKITARGSIFQLEIAVQFVWDVEMTTMNREQWVISGARTTAQSLFVFVEVIKIFSCTCDDSFKPSCQKTMCKVECDNPKKIDGQCCPACDGNRNKQLD